MQHRSRGAALLAALVLVACGDDPAEPAPASEYALSIQGDITETASGPAWFGSDVNNAGEPIFVLLLGQDTSRHIVLAGKAGATRPATGTYDIVDPESDETGWTVLHLVTEADELLAMLIARSGALTITESSATVLRGSIAFDAVGFMGEEEAVVEVTGTFVAAPASALSMAPAIPALPAIQVGQ